MRGNPLVKTIAFLAFVALGACGDSSSPNRRQIDLSFSSQGAPTPLLRANTANFDITVSSGGNTVVITKAQLVLRDIKLKPSTETCAVEGAAADACATIHVGPTLVNLPLTVNAVTSISASVPPGTYRRVQLKMHKPSDDAEDAAFVTANPAFANISIRVEGTYNGQAFVFTSDLNENIELSFNPAVVIDADNQNVTVQVDIGSWFKSGTTVIDPNTANKGGANENTVRNKIRASLRAIEDNDRNGR